MTTISNGVRPPLTLASLRWLQGLTAAERDALGAEVTSALEQSWLLRAREDQKDPYEAQALWLMLGGRGSGKTFAGAG